jgi:hypothetical protein
MAKCSLRRPDLEMAALTELRALEGCETVCGVAIEFVRDDVTGANWRISTVTRSSEYDPSECPDVFALTFRAVEATHKKLRDLYSLRLDA